MPDRSRETRETPPALFSEAVAQWRLALRTEVKRTSSLPTSMFDACDPMLEMRLAETTEAMLACLHEPTPRVETQTGAPGDKRVETVTADELQALPRLLAAGDHLGLDLDDDLLAEAMAVLADACCSGHDAAADGAAHLLRHHAGIDAHTSAEAAAAALSALLQRELDDRAAASPQVASICERVVALVQRQLHSPRAPETRP